MREWFRKTTGGLPATFWYLWAGTLINRLGAFILVLLAIYLTLERGFSDAQAGLVMGLWGAGGAVGTMTGGVLADRWGRRPTLLTAHLGAAAAMVGLGFARDYWLILTVAFVLGAFAEAARPAFGAMMVDVVPDRDRLRAFSLNYWAINLGFACSAILAGFAAEFDYLIVFLVDAATTVVTAGIIFFKVRETRPVAAVAPTTHPGAKGPGIRAVLGDRVYLAFVVVNLFSALVFLQHASMLPIAMSDEGLSPSTYGWVISLNGVLIVLGQLFIPRFIEGRGRANVLALASVIIGIGFGLTAFANSLAWFYAITVLVWTLGEMLQSPSISTSIAELSPSDMRGRYQGLLSLSWSVAAFAGPVLGGLVRETAGNTALWLGVGGLALLVAVAHRLSGPARERRAAELRPRATTPPDADDVTPAPPGTVGETLAPTASA